MRARRPSNDAYVQCADVAIDEESVAFSCSAVSSSGVSVGSTILLAPVLDRRNVDGAGNRETAHLPRHRLSAVGAEAFKFN